MEQLTNQELQMLHVLTKDYFSKWGGSAPYLKETLIKIENELSNRMVAVNSLHAILTPVEE